jgi:TetR/AcrR family transcriptional repressor of nem operon
MKVTREQAAQNHDRIVEAAARLFRERGFEGIGVADLMEAAGLTHGGFYGHFASKEELIAEACRRALEGSIERWSRRVESEPRDPLGALARGYLSARHRDDPGAGCLLAALGPEVARHGPGARRAITAWLTPALDFLARHVPGTAASRRRRAIATLSGWIGAMVLARAVDDRELSREILDAVRECTTAS